MTPAVVGGPIAVHDSRVLGVIDGCARRHRASYDVLQSTTDKAHGYAASLTLC
jgi:hypothetical protein